MTKANPPATPPGERRTEKAGGPLPRHGPPSQFPCRDTCKPDILLAAHKLVLDSKEKLAAGEPLAATILVN